MPLRRGAREDPEKAAQRDRLQLLLWAYHTASTVRVGAKRVATEYYSWGGKALRFVRCTACGCVMCWQRAKPDPERKMGVNIRNFGLDVLRSVRIQPLDGTAWDGRTH